MNEPLWTMNHAKFQVNVPSGVRYLQPSLSSSTATASLINDKSSHPPLKRRHLLYKMSPIFWLGNQISMQLTSFPSWKFCLCKMLERLVVQWAWEGQRFSPGFTCLHWDVHKSQTCVFIKNLSNYTIPLKLLSTLDRY